MTNCATSSRSFTRLERRERRGVGFQPGVGRIHVHVQIADENQRVALGGSRGKRDEQAQSSDQ